ncbi:MAG: hypothetical protein ACK42I_06990 [Thermomicrobium sp.]
MMRLTLAEHGTALIAHLREQYTVELNAHWNLAMLALAQREESVLLSDDVGPN